MTSHALTLEEIANIYDTDSTPMQKLTALLTSLLLSLSYLSPLNHTKLTLQFSSPNPSPKQQELPSAPAYLCGARSPPPTPMCRIFLQE